MIAWAFLLAAFVWNYWGTMFHVVRVWATTPDYQYCFVVPLFSAYLLWHRQEMVDPWPASGTLWCIPFFVVFAIARWMFVYLNYERDIDSIFPFFLGLTLALGGWKALRWAWPSILFLIFMVPLPKFAADGLHSVLQRGATAITVYVLQTLGIPAFASGNEIQLSDPKHPLEVAAACSGLRMMHVFFAICIGACFVLSVPWWKKLILLASAAPIAVICNVFRIGTMGVLQERISVEAGQFFHEHLGVLEVVPALLLIWGELALLSALLIEPVSEGPLIFNERGSMRRRSPPVGMGGMAEAGRAAPISGVPPRPPQV